MATLDELINSMYDMVQDAKGIPLAGEKCILERDRLLICSMSCAPRCRTT